MIEVKVSFDTDMKRAMEDTRHWAVLALTPEEKISVHSPEEMERLADGLSAERAASRWIVSTDPDEHVERIGYYLDLGFDHLVFHAPGPDQERFLRLYAEHVLPRLRRRFGAPDETPQERMTSLEVIALAGPAVDQRRRRPGRTRCVSPQAQRRHAAGRDVLVVAQKIVSKAEGRLVDLATIEPSAKARHACGGCRQGPAAC